MIKDLKNLSGLKINVVLKNGEQFLGKDIPSSPCGQFELVVSFWHKGGIRAYPLDMVAYYELYEDVE